MAGIGVARLSDTVDDGFQRRWSRVFFMLFAFNLLAAGTLLRVAAWELRDGSGGSAGTGDPCANERAGSKPRYGIGAIRFIGSYRHV